MLDRSWTGYETALPTIAAADAAIQIMEAGGNATDAAIAAAHVLGVVEPLDCGIGAGGFMIIHNATSGRTDAIDFLGVAPTTARYQLYATNTVRGEYVIQVKGQHNQVGHRAVATPGTLRGFAEMHARYGKLLMAELFAPAIELAEAGYPVSYKGALRMSRTIAMLNQTPACRALYLKSETEAPTEGDWIVNADYGATLRLIAQEGADALYQGPIAEMRAHDGFLTHEDLRNYKALWRKPARGNFKGLDVATMPAPSSGPLVFAGLNALAHQSPQGEVETHEALARAMLHMFEARRTGFGDPAFVPISTPSGKSTGESSETTSLCTLDIAGNAACITYSNNNHSGVVVPGTGILLNNQMALFSPWPDNPNQIIGGKHSQLNDANPTVPRRQGGDGDRRLRLNSDSDLANADATPGSGSGKIDRPGHRRAETACGSRNSDGRRGTGVHRQTLGRQAGPGSSCFPRTRHLDGCSAGDPCWNRRNHHRRWRPPGPGPGPGSLSATEM